MTTTAHPLPTADLLPRPVRSTQAAAFCLVAGAALNTAQAVMTRLVTSGDSSAARLGDVDRHPVALLVMILGGALGVVLLLVGFQWLARRLAATAPRAARVGGLLTLAGTLGFLGVHTLMLVSYAAAGMADRDAAVAVLDHLDRSPVVLAVVVPFLVGMFGGVLALTVALFRTPSVPRWVPVVWALFVPIDFVAAGRSPVDPHWLFLAGALGLAWYLGREGRTTRGTALPAPAASSVTS